MHLRTDTSSNSHFSRVPTISHSRNSFSISEKHVTTIQFDKLFPMFNKFIYPGDTISIEHKALARLQTQTTTLFDDLYMDYHVWFTPLRLIQTDWARYQFNAQPLGPSQDNSALTSPALDTTGALGTSGFPSKSLYDYFGYPTLVGVAGGQHINNYYARAYNLTWNLNYRDQNLQNAVVVDLDNGPDLYTDYVLLPRGKRHDMFTSALTAQQKGPAASLPLGSSAPIYGDGTVHKLKPGLAAQARSVYMRTTDGAMLMVGTPPASDPSVFFPQKFDLEPNTGLYADLTSVTGATINALRTSVAIQHLLEADARGGTRDVESIQHRWGVTVPDYRLQRPEYLGGATFSFDGHVVPQTSESGTTPQANLAQFSQNLSSFHITHSFVEHGVLMILVSARSNITYQQGLARELSYKTRFDWYQPEFANLGEVAIKNKEIYFSGTVNDDGTFGFQEYGYELRYGLNRVSAEMRSNYPQSLDSKHMADDYSSLPTLSAGWIQSNTPISRNIVVSSSVADPIEFNQLVTGSIARTLPMFSIPGLDKL